MVTSLLLLASLGLAPAQNGKLSISDVRFTYGYLGATRTDTNFLPGDKTFLAYNVKNMKLDENGKASFSIAMEIISPDGKVLHKQNPQNKVAQNYLGGELLPSVATGNIPLKFPAGEYTIKVTVVDRNSTQQTSFEVKPKVLPAAFGIVHVEPALDAQGLVPSPPVGTIGESIYVNFAVVGFNRNKDTKQPDIKVSMRILDENGKQTMPNPLTGRANADIPEEINILPLQFALTLNRIGNFTIELTASDEVGGTNSRVSFPLRVIDPNAK